MVNWFTANANAFWIRLKSAFWDATKYLWDDTRAPWDAVSNDPWYDKNDDTWQTKS